MKSSANLHMGKDGTAKFSIPSTQITSDLARVYNIGSRKSLTLDPPNLSTVRDRKAFVAGYIDGDGCFRYGAQSKSSDWKYIVLEIVGTEQMLTWINTVIPQPGSIRKIDNYFVLQLQCKKAFEAYNYLHNPNLPLLERKWDMRYRVWSPREVAA